MEFKGTKWTLGGASGRMIKSNQYGGFVADVDTKANALLISKAPEMLEMLAHCMSLMEDASRHYKSITLNKAIKDTEKLIKQATEL